jgi:glycosyltransferase involved in cell wall biosynthesis
MPSRSKIAIVHDYLNQYGGAERVLELFHQIYPQAPVYTIVYDQTKVPHSYRQWDIRTSFINRLPWVRRHYEKYFFLYPWAIENLDLSGYDIIISSSSAWAKGAVKRRGAVHICYMYNAMRFVWDWKENVLREHHQLIQPLLKLMLESVKRWDIRTASNPDVLVVDSIEVQKRVEKYYNRSSLVLNPGVDTEYFRPGSNTPGEYYLAVARLKPYKRIDVAVQAFNRWGRSLIIAGDGPELKRLRDIAGPNIRFVGKVSDEDLLSLYQNCRAMIFTPLEDFGIAPLEAQACGRPVIAFGKGGSLETVVDGITGMFYYHQDPEALLEILEKFEKSSFSPSAIRDHAIKYDNKIFIAKFREIVENEWLARQGSKP